MDTPSSQVLPKRSWSNRWVAAECQSVEQLGRQIKWLLFIYVILRSSPIEMSNPSFPRSRNYWREHRERLQTSLQELAMKQIASYHKLSRKQGTTSKWPYYLEISHENSYWSPSPITGSWIYSFWKSARRIRGEFNINITGMETPIIF